MPGFLCRAIWLRLVTTVKLGWYCLYETRMCTTFSEETSEGLLVLLADMGVVPIKILQILHGDQTLPTALQKVCTRMLSDGPRHSIAYTLHVLQGSPIAHRISDVSVEPIGSGSVAQVHTCMLDRETPCVLKVRHPLVREDLFVVTILLEAMLYVCGSLAGFGTDGKALLADLYQQSDFRVEAGFTTKMRAILTEEIGPGMGLDCPSVLCTTKDLLVLSRQPGIHPTLDTVGSQTMEQIYRKLSGFFLYTNIIHGFAHGDLHTGNVLYDPTSRRLSIIDMGSCLRLPIMEQHPLPLLVRAICSNPPSIASQNALFETYMPTAAPTPEVVHAFTLILSEISTISSDTLRKNLFRFGLDHGLTLDSNVFQYNLQMGRMGDNIRFSVLAGSSCTELAVILYEACQIARHSIAPAKEVHILFLQSLETLVVHAHPRGRDYRPTYLV